MIELKLNKVGEMQYVIKRVGYNLVGGITWNFPADALEGVTVNITKHTPTDMSCDDFFPKHVREYMSKWNLESCGYTEVA